MGTPRYRKPALAAWIQGERKRLKLKPKDISDRLTAMGLDATEQTVKVWESNSNRRPNPYNLEGLERIFQSRAPDTADASAADQGDVADAIREQTEVMRVQTLLLAELLTAVRPGPGRLDIDKILDEFEATHPRRGTGSLPRPVRDRTGAGSAQLADPATAASGKQA